MKLLAIDDNHFNLITLKGLLDALLPEATLITSQSAADGMRRAALEHPDAILMDIQMPGMDGIDATRRLKGYPGTQHIPIILLTAHCTHSAWKLKGIEAGADAFLAKPIEEAELVAQIKAMVRIKRSEDLLRRERDTLEELVEQRTAELTRANAALQENMAFLKESEERFSRAVAGASDGLWDWDITTGSCYYSMRWKELLGFSGDELAHTADTFFSRLHLEDRQAVQDALRVHLQERVPYDVEVRLRTKSGEFNRYRCRGQAEWDETGSPVRMAGGLTDVTERWRFEEQLRQAQKMEAVGQLAGGVAHDFNNILTVIGGYASLLKMELKREGRAPDLVENIVAAAERAGQLTRGLLAFSRRQAMAPRRSDLNRIVRHVEKFLTRVMGEDIQQNTELHFQPLPVYVDSGHIEQVLINLAANARDAMPKGGAFTIRTTLEKPDRFLSSQLGEISGRYALMSVSDTGNGMDAETMKRLFEPFFTTKEVGKGTGLGMAIVYGIIQQHNGFINVTCPPGQGAIIDIYLPIIEEQEAALDATDSAAPAIPEPGTGTILLAEDDTSVREMVEMVLRKFGYDVIVAKDGEEVLEKFSAHRDCISMILMDIIMPKKNGIEALAAIKELQPEAKVLFTSGYTSDFIKSRGVDGCVDLLIKPVQPVELLRKIHETLKTAASPAGVNSSPEK